MRAIRFRAWDGHKIQMVTDLTDMEQGDTGYVTYADGTHNRLGYYPLMQYTGLKDSKHTKEYPEDQEIYEGDILKQTSWDKVERVLKPVEWEFKYLTYYCGIQSLSSLIGDIEIIGNIYEHEHLLKGGAV